jgi:hypothetical protein
MIEKSSINSDLSLYLLSYSRCSHIKHSYNSSNWNDVARERLSIRERVLTHKVVDITDKMKSIWEFIKKKLTNTQESQKRYADQKRIISFDYVVEDIVWLFIENIKTERSFKKLNHKWIESYKVKKILKDVCQLNLSSFMKIHDTFHTFLLRSAATNFLIKQIQQSSLSIVMNEEEKYEVNDILDNRYHYDKLQYRIVWIDHSSDRTWYSTKNFEHSKNILADFHQRYFQKSESDLRMIVIIETMLSQWIKDEHKETKQLIQNVFNRMKAEMKESDRKRINKDSFKTNDLAREQSWVSAY